MFPSSWSCAYAARAARPWLRAPYAALGPDPGPALLAAILGEKVSEGPRCATLYRDIGRHTTQIEPYLALLTLLPSALNRYSIQGATGGTRDSDR